MPGKAADKTEATTYTIRSTVEFQPKRRAMPPTTPASTRSSAGRDRLAMAMRALLRPFSQPLVDGRGHLLLRAAGDVDADVAAAEGQFGIILAADHVLQRTRGIRRHQVVVLGEDVEHRHLHQPQVDLVPA